MTQKSDTKFKEKRTCGFWYDVRDLFNFHQTIQKSENFLLMGSFCSKYKRFELQKFRGVTFHGTEQLCKMWINLYLVVSKMPWGIWWTFIRALKSLKNCILIGSFCPKHMFQLENFIGFMCHYTEKWWKIWRKTDLWLEKWHKKHGQFSCEQSKVWKFAFWCACFIQSI